MPRVLIVGGSGFVGSWLTRAAVQAGCDVTILNRGKTDAALPDVERITADRDGDLSALHGQRWDLVLDGIAYGPQQVTSLLDAIGDGLGHYVLISTISAVDLDRESVPETAPGIVPEDPENPTYGEAKALCEAVVHERLGHRALVVRPGLIGGPGDLTDRATYWAMRAERGGRAIAPGSPADGMQLIDVRDLAPFLVRAGLAQESGTMHAVGHIVPFGRFLQGVADRTGNTVEWVWANAETIEKHGLKSWTDLPAWVPAVGKLRGATRVSREQAETAGLWTREPDATAVDAWRWRQATPDAPPPKHPVGLDPEREAEILADL